MAKMANEINE
uniref:Uncharacterized protein n=1 Tax=Lepeophtheirus salmonis TaxID=72036 RepID=A0A0K2UKC7_LEPSM